MELHIDIETYSSVDIKKAGAYKYVESADFEIMLMAYAFDNEPVEIIDFTNNEKIPPRVLAALKNPRVTKLAHNANFERIALKKIGFNIPINEWKCTAILSAYAGLPRSLEQVSVALRLGEKAKMAEGKQLIRFFCLPCKPSKSNDYSTRNISHQNNDKWLMFKEYCMQDVEAEREISKRLAAVILPDIEKQYYLLDQVINDRGVKVDIELAKKALLIDSINSKKLTDEIVELTGVSNPNSDAQIKNWILDETGVLVKSLAKDAVDEVAEHFASNKKVMQVLDLRAKTSKTSIKKYESMLNCVCKDDRVRGLFAHYGANRTGRWAGRLVQLHNLKRNSMRDLDYARTLVKQGNYQMLQLNFGDVSEVLSQLIRTAFIAEDNKVLSPCDFSAIEARVIAWLADEKWRLDIFNSHGKIYEASAAMMFNVPISQITKGSDLRQKGKIAELALGYQGGVGALKKMGGESMGLSEKEMGEIVGLWRSRNTEIVKLWNLLNAAAIECIDSGLPFEICRGRLLFRIEHDCLTLQLPSGRKLYYREPKILRGKYGPAASYMGLDQTTNKWLRIDTYGGKLAENVVQAIARDLLAYSMNLMYFHGYDITMHVHDEAVAEVPDKDFDIKSLENLMSIAPKWAKGLPLKAEGFTTKYYKKD
jgi:DNA polymerase bacteriophage-type